jgi:hypothetical protein
MNKAISVRAAKGADMLIKVVSALEKANIKPRDLSVHRPSLDDVFLAVTGKKTSPQSQKTKTSRGKK